MKLLHKILVLLFLFAIGCVQPNDIDDNSENDTSHDYNLYIESTNQWNIGSKLKGRFLDNKRIEITWKIDSDKKAEITGYRVFRRAWHEEKYTFIKSLSANDSVFVDLLPDNQIKPTWFYTIYADTKNVSNAQSSGITVWKIKNYYDKPTQFELKNTKFWIVNQPGNSLSKESRFCIAEFSKWEQLFNKTYGALFYRNSLNSATIPELNALIQAKNNFNFKLGIETSGFQNVSATEINQLGERSYESEMRALTNLTLSKGKIDYVFFDGPIRNAMFPNGAASPRMTLSEASRELVDLMLLYRNYNPEIKFFLISNFSNWGWDGIPARNTNGIGSMGYGDYKEVLDSVLQLADKKGVRFDGVSLDFSYEAYLNEGSSDQIDVVKSIDYGNRLKQIYDYIRSNGYTVSISLNNNRGGNANSNIFRVEMLNYLEELLLNGMTPNHILHQTWNPYPDFFFFFSQKNTFTNMGLELVKKYKIGK